MNTFAALRYPFIDLEKFECIPLGELVTITTGCGYAQHEWPQDNTEVFTLIDKIHNEQILLSEPRYMRVSERERQKFTLKKGDILFQQNTTSQQLAKSSLFDLNLPVLHTKYLRISPGSEIDSQYLLFILNTLRYAGKLHAIATKKSNICTIGAESLRKIDIPLLPLEQQIIIASAPLETE